MTYLSPSMGRMESPCPFAERPLRHCIEDGFQSLSCGGKSVGNIGRHYRFRFANDQSIVFQLFQMLYQHFLGDSRYRSFQLAITLGAFGEMVKNNRFPIAAYL